MTPCAVISSNRQSTHIPEIHLFHLPESSHLMGWDWWALRAGPNCFIGISCSFPFCLLLSLSMGWYCGAGVFGLMRYQLLSLGLELLTLFNKNNNNNIGRYDYPWPYFHLFQVLLIAFCFPTTEFHVWLDYRSDFTLLLMYVNFGCFNEYPAHSL